MSRTDDIQAELRASAPAAPDHLRSRVQTITTRESARRRPAFGMRRTSLVLVGGLVLLAIGAAAVQGLTAGDEKSAARDLQGGLEVTLQGVHSTQATSTTAGFRNEPVTGRAAKALKNSATGGATDLAPLKGSAPGSFNFDTSTAATAAPRTVQVPAARAQKSVPLSGSSLPPSGLRLQNYDVELGIRVKDSDALSAATVKAMRWTRAYGGFVASVAYDTPGGNRGASELQLRVPVGKVQEAMQKFSSLGVLTSQHVSIEDLQGTVNTQTKRIITLNRRIGAILTTLQTTQTVEKTAQLQAELAARRQELAALQVTRAATVRQGRLAHFYLELQTQAKKKHVVVPVKPHKQGTIAHKLHSAGHVLAQELAFVLAALVIGAPFILLGAIGFATARGLRRRTDRRLLDATPS